MSRESLKLVGLALVGGAGALVVLLVAVLVYLNATLPPVERLENPEYSLPTAIYDRNGIKLQEVFIKRRKLVSYEQLPATLINGLIAKEDSRFFEHHGIDPLRMLKAAWVNLLQLKTAQGASTLTQQTARQFFLTLEKTWSRKVREILLALKIEREFTKREILTLYLNKVNFGDAWGVAAAAEFYFDKPVENLSLAEAATLVGLLPAPNRYKPTRNPHLARQQRTIVLQRMAEEGFITRDEQAAAASEPILLARHANDSMEAVAYYIELVRRELLEKYGSKNVYEGGLHVYTAMDLTYQIAAYKALIAGVEELDRRRGYRGPLDHIDPDETGRIPDDVLVDLNPPNAIEEASELKAVVTGIEDDQVHVALGQTLSGVVVWESFKDTWQNLNEQNDLEQARPIGSSQSVFKVGDVVQARVRTQDPLTGQYVLDIYQEPMANGAVYAMDPRSGEVLALVGGTRFGKALGASEFIRATQAERQPGSSFKPIIYAAAIDEGFTPATVLEDSPVAFTLTSGKKHIPQNYDNNNLGAISLRESLVRSRNVSTVQLVNEMGPRRVIEFARRFGFTTGIPEETLIALGTHSVKLSELTRAYAVFAAQGKLVTPIYITRIEDSSGNVLLRNEPSAEPVISEATAYLVTDMLQDVVRSPLGTGYRAMEGFKRPAAGKTGTTQNYSDAWYIGMIPQLVSGVYVGFDDPKISLGPSETGSRTAAPIWKNFMVAIESSLPVESFRQPPTVVAHRVGPGGNLLGPCDDQTGSRFELFKANSIPERLLSRQNCVTAVNSHAAEPVVKTKKGPSEDVDL
ncbi:MAG: PBP1A family penicillin-binding protein [Candidatus Lambdaproteobacteria bacterium]|nr:PBP1A family penicillin-binding protein [Candidatus Lambdaproteobacteria bacterium]